MRIDDMMMLLSIDSSFSLIGTGGTDGLIRERGRLPERVVVWTVDTHDEWSTMIVDSCTENIPSRVDNIILISLALQKILHTIDSVSLDDTSEIEDLIRPEGYLIPFDHDLLQVEVTPTGLFDKFLGLKVARVSDSLEIDQWVKIAIAFFVKLL